MRETMKKQTSSNVLEKIEIARERIKELETMIDHWERKKLTTFDNECYLNPSSQGCLLYIY